MTTWISNFASVAEDVLNQVDQSAGKVLRSKDQHQFVDIEVDGSPFKVSPAKSLVKSRSSSQLDEENLTDIYQSPRSHSTPPSVISRSSSFENQSTINSDLSSTYSFLQTPNLTSSHCDDENQILKSEIQSLNAEIAQAFQRARNSERAKEKVESLLTKRTNEYNKECSDLRNSLEQNAKYISELSQSISDYDAALKSKDIQMASMRATIDTELHSLKEQESNNDSIKSKLNSEIDRLRKEIDQITHEKSLLSSSLSNADDQIASLKSSVEEYQHVTSTHEQQLKSLRIEHNEYKQRAQTILHAKESLITSLKSGIASSHDGGLDDLHKLELEQARQESSMLSKELVEARLASNTAAEVAKRVELEWQRELSTQRLENNNLSHQLTFEQDRLASLREEYEEILQIHSVTQRELKCSRDRVLEMEEKLKTELAQRATLRQASAPVNNTINELNSRLQSLTQSLIEKNAVIDSLGQQRQDMSLTIEKLERNTTHNPIYNNINTVTEESRLRTSLPAFLLPSPIDNACVTGFKRTLVQLDRLSHIFMRRALWASAALITSSAILNTAKSLNLSSSLSEENVKNIVAQFVTDSITPLDTLVQRPNDMRTKIELLAMKTQAEMCKALSAEENNATWRVDKWDRKEGGGGVSCIMEDGAVIEKGGVNVSVVHGSLSGPALQNMKSRGHEIFQSPAPFFACGVSCVIHPRNPFVPTIHFNYRYFEVEAGNGRKISWFGGGTDLTPYYLNEKDVVHFHKTLRDACDAERRDEGKFSEYKKWCDKYFFIPHRGESRGVGGIFFDDLTDDPSENTFDFVRRCAESVVPSYLPIVKANKDLPFSKENRDWQLLRRGRYVEFNLVYDRGTKFGLNTPGSRTESILMSLPATANWEYCHSPKVGSPEEKLMKVLKSPKDWV